MYWKVIQDREVINQLVIHPKPCWRGYEISTSNLHFSLRSYKNFFLSLFFPSFFFCLLHTSGLFILQIENPIKPRFAQFSSLYLNIVFISFSLPFRLHFFFLKVFSCFRLVRSFCVCVFFVLAPLLNPASEKRSFCLLFAVTVKRLIVLASSWKRNCTLWRLMSSSQ